MAQSWKKKTCRFAEQIIGYLDTKTLGISPPPILLGEMLACLNSSTTADGLKGSAVGELVQFSYFI